MSTVHTEMFRPSRFHGEQMDGEDDAYYIALRNDTSGISGYVTRAEFNWLAERLGFAPLPDEKQACPCGAFEMGGQILHSATCPHAGTP